MKNASRCDLQSLDMYAARYGRRARPSPAWSSAPDAPSPSPEVSPPLALDPSSNVLFANASEPYPKRWNCEYGVHRNVVSASSYARRLASEVSMRATGARSCGHHIASSYTPVGSAIACSHPASTRSPVTNPHAASPPSTWRWTLGPSTTKSTAGYASGRGQAHARVARVARRLRRVPGVHEDECFVRKRLLEQTHGGAVVVEPAGLERDHHLAVLAAPARRRGDPPRREPMAGRRVRDDVGEGRGRPGEGARAMPTDAMSAASAASAGRRPLVSRREGGDERARRGVDASPGAASDAEDVEPRAEVLGSGIPEASRDIAGGANARVPFPDEPQTRARCAAAARARLADAWWRASWRASGVRPKRPIDARVLHLPGRAEVTNSARTRVFVTHYTATWKKPHQHASFRVVSRLPLSHHSHTRAHAVRESARAEGIRGDSRTRDRRASCASGSTLPSRRPPDPFAKTFPEVRKGERRRQPVL